eukprot:COSAG05_NODE_3244_length_2213_cov_40.222751_3_plen_73_part_01
MCVGTAGNVEWADIAGLAFAKKCVEEMVIMPIMRPDIFKGMRSPPKVHACTHACRACLAYTRGYVFHYLDLSA